MSKERYLLDTHAFFFWITKEVVSEDFCDFFDALAEKNKLFVSLIVFWELAFLVSAKKIAINNLDKWGQDVLTTSGVQLLHPEISDFVLSTQLPKHHKDPFDRLLIAQAKNSNMLLVTKDKLIKKYDVKTFWKESCE